MRLPASRASSRTATAPDVPGRLRTYLNGVAPQGCEIVQTDGRLEGMNYLVEGVIGKTK